MFLFIGSNSRRETGVIRIRSICISEFPIFAFKSSSICGGCSPPPALFCFTCSATMQFNCQYPCCASIFRANRITLILQNTNISTYSLKSHKKYIIFDSNFKLRTPVGQQRKPNSFEAPQLWVFRWVHHVSVKTAALRTG